MIITPHRIRVVRRVGLSPGALVSTVDSPEDWFRGEIIPPEDVIGPAEETSPRNLPAYTLRWTPGILGPQDKAPARPGERVESDDVLYETLGLPRRMWTGRRVSGHEVAVQRIDVLYPYTATLQDQGGVEIREDLLLGMWAPDDVRADRGQYLTYQAESPPEFYPELVVKNRQVILNGIAFRVVDPYVILQAPRVRYILRGPR